MSPTQGYAADSTPPRCDGTMVFLGQNGKIWEPPRVSGRSRRLARVVEDGFTQGSEGELESFFGNVGDEGLDEPAEASGNIAG